MDCKIRAHRGAAAELCLRFGFLLVPVRTYVGIMRSLICIWTVCAVVIGCAAPGPDSAGDVRQDIAEISVSANVVDFAVHVILDVDGETKELTFQPTAATATGSLFVTPGTRTVVARAFLNDELIAASNPVIVEAQALVTTHVALRLIDVSAPQPRFGPIFDSIVFPTAVQAGVNAAFSATAVSPGNDPITYRWSSSCPDSTFGTTDTPTTTWFKPAVGSCQVTIVAVSRGISTSASFTIEVFPAGQADGAFDVTAVIVFNPQVFLTLDGLACGTDSSVGGGSCSSTIGLPSTSTFFMTVDDWRLSTPGTLDLSDSCGGEVRIVATTSTSIEGVWSPPASGGLCFLTGRAINGDGGVATVVAAVVTHPGTPGTSSVPQIDARVSVGNGPCRFQNSAGSEPTQCGTAQSIFFAEVEPTVDWGTGDPGTVRIAADCGGPPSTRVPYEWMPRGASGDRCTVTVRATSLQGVEGIAQAQFMFR